MTTPKDAKPDPKTAPTHEQADDGRYVARGKRFDAQHDAGARVIRAGEKAIAQQLKAAGASPGSADWGGAAGHSGEGEPDPDALGFATPSDEDAKRQTAGNPSGGPKGLKPGR
jgi:hypothetical protein